MKAFRSTFFTLYINFKRANAVDCWEPMPLKEEPPLHHLDGETPSFVKVGKVDWHKEVLVVLRRHTQSFRWVEIIIVAGVQAEPEGR